MKPVAQPPVSVAVCFVGLPLYSEVARGFMRPFLSRLLANTDTWDLSSALGPPSVSRVLSDSLNKLVIFFPEKTNWLFLYTSWTTFHC